MISQTMINLDPQAFLFFGLAQRKNNINKEKEKKKRKLTFPQGPQFHCTKPDLTQSFLGYKKKNYINTTNYTIKKRKKVR